MSQSTNLPTVHLHPGKDKPVRHRHPWIFSGAIERVRGDLAPSGSVDVLDSRGEWLARGYANPKSQIVVRLLTWDRDEELDAGFWRGRLAAAAARRADLAADPQTDAYRLIYAESDGVPGLIVDRYGDWLATQFLTAGVEARRELLLQALAELFAPRGIVDRSDVAVRRQEGLALHSGLAWGEPPPDDLAIREHGHSFRADLLGGQKTGFYLDQRENRRIVGIHAAGRRVLNAFSFTGAFAVYALAGGAQHVTNLDSSHEALVGAEHALRLNGFDPDAQAEAIEGDVFQVLRSFRDEGRQFDMVILDPPKFAQEQGRARRRDARLQGHQPARAQAIGPGRAAGDLLVLRSGHARSVPEDRFRRQRGCRPRRPDHREAGPGRRSPDPAELPGGRVPEGVAVPGGLTKKSANQQISK